MHAFWWWVISGSALIRPQTYNRLLDSLLAYGLDKPSTFSAPRLFTRSAATSLKLRFSYLGPVAPSQQGPWLRRHLHRR